MKFSSEILNNVEDFAIALLRMVLCLGLGSIPYSRMSEILFEVIIFLVKNIGYEKRAFTFMKLLNSLK